MNSRRRLARFALAVLGTAALTTTATGQRHPEESVSQFLNAQFLGFQEGRPAVARRGEQPHRCDEEFVHLIERLEVGMSALEEVGAHDALHLVAQVAQRLRHQRQEARHRHEDEHRGHDLSSLEARFEILRHARHAFEEVEDEKHVHYLNRVIEVGELQATGADAQEIVHAMEGISMGNVVELLTKASRIWGEFGHESKAGACAELARYYTARNRPEGAEGEHRAEANLEDRGRRLEIIELALKAHAEAEHGDATHFLERFLHMGHLQLKGADDEKIAQASVGLSMEDAIRLIRKAAGLYAEWGNPDRADMCASLAEYYAHKQGEGAEHEAEQHDAEHEHEDDAEHEHEDDGGDDDREGLARRVKIIAMAHDAHSRAGNREAADLLERAAHLGHLLLEDMGSEEIARAAEGFSTEDLIHPLRVAGELYQEWGKGDRAHACRELAKYYHERDAGEGEEQRRETERRRAEDHEVERHEAELRQHREDGADRAAGVMRRIERLHQGMQRLQMQMDELRAVLEKVTREARGER